MAKYKIISCDTCDNQIEMVGKRKIINRFIKKEYGWKIDTVNKKEYCSECVDLGLHKEIDEC